ncbi:1-deoxy-D-xylulose 5-phosphate reductoisomerase [Kaistia soli DSM 19436]|uniref:1-deoxy-D-xylulose 5-phosphate reductoisomerase n=1 Tax=Kaistia soli DSM 19436 TaxID=1122133 RepID=A0A1M5H5V5_9HYPH|nr:1-deoxy-D-xylulose-5-phosphate reductoisomerase [Kaistia soli]SHG11122.1 1-deoxy-D-xylulose 5-phosphate reductoisomerase [Kaistia soli DSM 19436]
MKTPVSLGRTPAPAGKPRRISILGATGSVGASTADVILGRPDAFIVEAVTAGTRARELAETAIRLKARIAVIADPNGYETLKAALAGTGIEAAAGEAAVIEAASRPVELVVAAIVGAAGLAPTIAAIDAGADIALANKECLVCAGAFFLSRAEAAGVHILPVDSEHNAIFQALEAENMPAVESITLTASGGPFRQAPIDAMRRATIAEALNHPRWSMGRKISIDSATMMNKGLEIIEAHFLFGLLSERLHVVVHPQSVVHGWISYADGSILAQLGAADMRIPIGHCLGWPKRYPATTKPFDLVSVGSLTFEKPDLERFPALSLARQALSGGNRATNVLNAANEVAVEAFLAGEIGFLDIAATVAETLDHMAAASGSVSIQSVGAALAIDAEGRRLARGVIDARRRLEAV